MSLLSEHDRRHSGQAQRAGARRAGLLECPFGLLGPAPASELVAHGSRSWQSMTAARCAQPSAPDVLAGIAPTSPRARLRSAHAGPPARSEEHTSELQSRVDLVCRLLL